MTAKSVLTALFFAAALGGCAELTAEAPLFAPADQVGPPPLTEGVWIAVQEHCPAYYARRRTGRFPSECSPMEIRRSEDGAWRISPRVDLISHPTAEDHADAEVDGPMRAIIAPAIEHPSPDAYSPLYVAEFSPRTDADSVGYAVIAPIGTMPATNALVIGALDCAVILREGPIEGITAEYTTPAVPGTPTTDSPGPTTDSPGPTTDSSPQAPTLSRCVASTQAAVREAARRAVIESLTQMTETRLVYVRPN
jgi:hypothetical protein